MWCYIVASRSRLLQSGTHFNVQFVKPTVLHLSSTTQNIPFPGISWLTGKFPALLIRYWTIYWSILWSISLVTYKLNDWLIDWLAKIVEWQQHEFQFPWKSVTINDNINSIRGPKWTCKFVLGPKWLGIEVSENRISQVQSTGGPKWMWISKSALGLKWPRNEVPNGRSDYTSKLTHISQGRQLLIIG